MIEFEVTDMTCGHCVGTITKAVMRVDAGAQVQVDLATHRVSIRPGSASAAVLHQAIQEAGYTPTPVEVPPGKPIARAAPSPGSF